MNAATAADPHTGCVGGFGALFLLVALCVVVRFLAVGGNFEEEVMVRLLSLVARMQNYLEKMGTL